MKKKMMLCLSLLIGITVYSQSKFQKGYFVSENGKKVQAFIKNEQWLTSPTNFSYKLIKNGEINTISIEEAKEFSVYKRFKYKRFNISVDNLKDNTTNFSNYKAPKFQNKTAFLKTIVEANQLSLYEYKSDNQTRYYYKKGNEKIILLRYNKYKKANGEIAENNEFKKQLSENIFAKCENLSLDVSYSSTKLGNYVIAYNNCNQISESLIDYRDYDLRGGWYFKAKVGVNSSTINVLNRSGRSGEQSGTNLRFGIEIEHFLKLKKKNWSIFFEPTYTSFKDDFLAIEYNSFEIPLGLRNYISLSDKSHLFLNAGLSLDFSGSSTIGIAPLNTGLSLFYGLGYSFDKKFSLEIRNYTNRNLAPRNNNILVADQDNIAIVLGYRFN